MSDGPDTKIIEDTFVYVLYKLLAAQWLAWANQFELGWNIALCDITLTFANIQSYSADEIFF